MPGRVFFDRGLIDAAAALHHQTDEDTLTALRRLHRYNTRVFLAPPWPEIYAVDHERRHDLAAAITEYERLREVYPSLGYEVHLLPKRSIAERADAVLARLAAG